MGGYKYFDCAATIICGIELFRGIRKGRFSVGGTASRTVFAHWPSSRECRTRRLVLAPPPALRRYLHIFAPRLFAVRSHGIDGRCRVLWFIR